VRSCDDLIGQLDFLSANCPHLDSLVTTASARTTPTTL
jgi:hypothetical protein